MGEVFIGWNADKNMQLLENEQIIWEGPADMFYVSHNIGVKIMMGISKLLSFLFGVRVTGHLILTNRRAYYSYSNYIFWVFRAGAGKHTVFNHQIASFEYGFQSSFLIFFKTKTLKINSTGPGSDINLALKKIKEKDLDQLVSSLSYSILNQPKISIKDTDIVNI